MYNLSRAALVPAAFCEGRHDLLAIATEDKLHQPYRMPLMPGSKEVFEMARLCGAKAVLLAGADGYKPGTPAYADSLLHAHTGRGAAFNTAMAGAIKACGLDVTFITPSEYAK